MSIAKRIARQSIRQNRYFSASATVIIEAAGRRNQYGEWEPGASQSTAQLLATTPLSGKERDDLPEGAREADARKFWLTSLAVPIRTGIGPTEGDRIVYDGTMYRAIRAEQWPGHWQVLGIRGEQDNA